MRGWPVGEIGEILDLMRDGEVIATNVRFGPGAMIRSGPIPVAVDIGDEVLRDLTWDWPPPYDGEVRQALVRHRDDVRRRMSYALFFGVDHPNAHFKIPPETLSVISP